MRRALLQLTQEAAWRHPDPAHPAAWPAATALAGEALGAAEGPLAARRWCERRDRWHDRALRRRCLPGHARVALIGAGLDPRAWALPPGLLGQGWLAHLDRADVLAARAHRLEAAGIAAPPQVITLAADPLQPDQVLAALRALGEGGGLALWIGGAGPCGVSGVEALVEGVAALGGWHLGMDWLATDAADEAALSPWGPPLPWSPEGLALWLRALGARDVQTDALLTRAGRPLGLGTLAAL
jgi:hypothetical protein